MNNPQVVCLCGSTRYWEWFRDQRLKLTLEGYIVLTIGSDSPDEMIVAHPSTPEGRLIKAKLDILHLRKIDLANGILVLNVNGYIGESTEREIEYARSTGKWIEYLEPPQ